VSKCGVEGMELHNGDDILRGACWASEKMVSIKKMSFQTQPHAALRT